MKHTLMPQDTEGHKVIRFFEDSLNKSLSIGDVRIPYRSLNHWDTKNLLLDSTRDQGRWRKFNFIEYIWLRIIVELRTFGASLNQIKQVKDALTFPIPLQIPEGQTVSEFKDYQLVYYNPLFLLIVEAILSRRPINILINAKGECFFYNPDKHDEYGDDRTKFTRQSHLSISVNELITNFFLIADETTLKNELDFLHKAELEVLLDIRAGKCEDVLVLKKDDDVLNFLKQSEKNRPSAYLYAIFNTAYDSIECQYKTGEELSFTRQTSKR